MLRDEEISVILVDENDNVVGFGDKLDVHRRGLLHRAFSVFLFDEQGRLLIQQRANSKYHAPGLWANTCCGHPFPGESIQDAATRRLKEELGFSCEVSPLTHIYYKKALDQGMVEHEYVHVLTGQYTGQKLRPDPIEVAATEWKLPQDIRHEHQDSDESRYAAWFAHYLEDYYDQLFGHLS